MEDYEVVANFKDACQVVAGMTVVVTGMPRPTCSAHVSVKPIYIIYTRFNMNKEHWRPYHFEPVLPITARRETCDDDRTGQMEEDNRQQMVNDMNCHLQGDDQQKVTSRTYMKKDAESKKE